MASGSSLGLAVSILAPVVWLQQKSRTVCLVSTLSYYLLALRSLPAVARHFFGPQSGLKEGLCFWLIAASTLSLPWFWAWTASRKDLLWRSPLALLLTVIPPLGLIGWASPTVAAGLLFPATGYGGFAVTVLLPGFLVVAPRAAMAGVIAGILLSHAMIGPTPPPPPDWEAVNTHFGSIAHGRIDILREHEAAQEIQSRLLLSPAHVIIFPEAVVPRWTEATDLFWSDTLTTLQNKGGTAVIGALQPLESAGTPGYHRSFELTETLTALQAIDHNVSSTQPARAWELEEPPRYRNTVIVRGAKAGEFTQRVPIPLGMWHPFQKTGVPLQLGGPGTIRIGGRPTALIICYEQLIAWPVLTSFLERPSVLVAISNNFWVSETRIPAIEHTTMCAWAELFHVPVLFAANN